jgi:hypothetical protein
MRPAKCGTSRLAVWVSATYRIPSVGFVCRIWDDERLTIIRQTIPNRLVVSVANLNRNLETRPKRCNLYIIDRAL